MSRQEAIEKAARVVVEIRDHFHHGIELTAAICDLEAALDMPPDPEHDCPEAKAMRFLDDYCVVLRSVMVEGRQMWSLVFMQGDQAEKLVDDSLYELIARAILIQEGR